MINNIVNYSSNEENLQELLDELSNKELVVTNPAPSSNAEPLQQQDAHQYFLDKTKAIIETGVGAVQEIAPYIVQGQSAKEIEALSKLIGATAQALDTLNRQTLINQKADRDEELERIRLEGKKELINLKLTNLAGKTVNNNIIIASREEILKNITLNSKNNDDVLQIENK